MPNEVRYMIDLSKIWEVIIKLISSPSFLTPLVAIITSLFSRFFPGLDPAVVNGFVLFLVQLLPILFAAEMARPIRET